MPATPAPRRRKTQLTSRKQPQQARSTELVAAVLQAAIQVLAREGIQRFTSARVAEAAGVSVGSLYQYFPNKAAILFRLQTDEWQQTTDLLSRLLVDGRRSPAERLRSVVHEFIRTECEEAEMRAALDDAAPLYRDAPEAQAARAAMRKTFTAFIAEMLPGAAASTRDVAADLVQDTLFCVGKRVSEGPRSAARVRAYGSGLADMLCAYLGGLQSPGT